MQSGRFIMERYGYFMRVAVTYENGQVFQHFGHCGSFKLYEVADGRVTDARVLDAAGSGHGALAGFLKGYEVDILICGGIGAGARAALTEAGIQLYGGVSGQADDAVQAFLSGTLVYNADVQCSHHHSHEGHGEQCQGHCHEDKHSCAGNGGCGA